MIFLRIHVEIVPRNYLFLCVLYTYCRASLCRVGFFFVIYWKLSVSFSVYCRDLIPCIIILSSNPRGNDSSEILDFSAYYMASLCMVIFFVVY
jgi:hypothetical protein